MHLPSSVCTMRLAWTLSAILSSIAALETGSVPANGLSLHRRQDASLSCSAVDPKLPQNFNCPTGTNCISLDNASSSLCCPEGDSCSNIQTISCNVQAQNVTSSPNASIFTTKLGDKLPACGTACCPFGYACVAQSGPPICSLIAATSKTGQTDTSSTSTGTSSSSSSSTASKTATSNTPAATSSAITTGVSSSASSIEPQCNKFPIGVFFAGFFPGIFIGAFMMLAWVICSGRHRTPASRRSASSSLYKPTISDPIPLDSGGGLRTEFLRRTTGRARSMFSMKSQNSPDLATNHWKMPTPPVPNNIPTANPVFPVTPERRLAHESSSESIRVYSPPSGNGAVQPINPAHIAPLRGMATQRYQPPNHMGSPFQSPPNNNATTDKMSSNPTAMRAVSGASPSPTDPEPETLTPARYEGAGWTPIKRVRPEGAAEGSRPNTTFTEMLHEAGFPDPMQDQGTPAVPKVPSGYGGRNRL